MEAAAGDETLFLVSLQPGATALSRNRREVVSFDLEGRPSTWMVDGRTYKRSLSSEIYGRRSVEGVRRRWRVDVEDAEAHFRRAGAAAAAAQAALERGSLRRAAGAERFRPLSADEATALAERLERIRGWTPERLAGERTRFLAAYEPVSILPPDQYGAIVLQATHGCSWNRCTFCTFYQDRPFAVREPAAFEAHAQAVGALLGASAAARRGVFLADGNALVLSNARLRPLFEVVRRHFPGRNLAGFVDVFGGERKPPGDWRELAAWGLTRVAVGLETGSDELLAYLNKPGSAAEAAAFVTTLKEAGLTVSVILMVGVGGEAYAARHEAESRSLLARLPLGRGDLVYLSPFVPQAGSAYVARIEAEGVRPLSREERNGQYRRMRRAVRAALPDARVALYHIDEFVY